MTGQSTAAAERSALHCDDDAPDAGLLVTLPDGSARLAVVERLERERDAAIAEATRLRAALQILLPVVDVVVGEGIEWTDPPLDPLGAMIAAAEVLGYGDVETMTTALAAA